MRNLLSAATLLYLAASPGFAQTGTASRIAAEEQKRPQILTITVTKVRPEMQREYETLLKNEVVPALKKGGVEWVGTWQTAGFGDQYEWVRVAPMQKFADRDQPSPVIAALGQEAAANLLERSRKCQVSMKTNAVALRRDLSLEKELSDPPNLAVVTTLRVAPGREFDFVRFLKSEILPVMRKAEMENYWVHQTVFGGNANEWTTVTPIKNFAELDKGSPFSRILGESGLEKLAAKGQGLTASMERSIARYRADLSYRSEKKK